MVMMMTWGFCCEMAAAVCNNRKERMNVFIIFFLVETDETWKLGNYKGRSKVIGNDWMGKLNLC